MVHLLFNTKQVFIMQAGGVISPPPPSRMWMIGFFFPTKKRENETHSARFSEIDNPIHVERVQKEKKKTNEGFTPRKKN